MKLTLGVFLVCSLGLIAVNGQDNEIRQVTADLLAAQADLAIGHRFFETAIYMNRGQISAYLQFINRAIIDSHIDTYAYIKNLGIETRDEINGLETDAQSEQCVARILNRWDLQINRYGHRLSGCVRRAHSLIMEMSVFVNDIHETAQFSGNQVQNIGISTLSFMQLFDGTDDIGTEINRNFRILLKLYLSYRDRFDGFLTEVAGEYQETIENLITCDVDISDEFKREIDLDLAIARNCVGENPGGEQTVAPTL
jgi:hypothetical protein